MTDRWKNQRADQADEQGEGMTPRFGWTPPAGEPAPSSRDDRRYEQPNITAAPSSASRSAGSTSPTDKGSAQPVHPETTSKHAQGSEPPLQPRWRSHARYQDQGETRDRTNPASEQTPPLPTQLEQWPEKVSRYRRVPHLAIITLATVLVLGGGFFVRDDGSSRSPALPDDRNTISFISSVLKLKEASREPEEAASARGVIASSAENVLSGHPTTSSHAVFTRQLEVGSYITRESQTIASVASETGLSEETLLWANEVHDPERPLPAGTRLHVPPTDGMLHVVSEDDTLESIAEQYDVTTEAITDFEPNDVERTADLTTEQLLMVPGGTMPLREDVIFYTVRDGDQLRQLANRFRLEPQTILWANNLTASEEIEPGRQLAILPVDGVMVTASDDDTVESLAEKHGVDPSAIRDWPANELQDEDSLEPGDSIMIPDGVPPSESESEPEPDPVPEPSRGGDDDAEVEVDAEADDSDETFRMLSESVEIDEEDDDSSEPSIEGTGEFIWPTTGVITQHFHATHNGWDIANVSGTEIWAADSGRVIFSGWNNYGLGYAVGIEHGNGYETWYGHMKEPPAVEEGDAVEKEEHIGLMGSTGFSTGPHVHFVIAHKGEYQDPGSYLE